MGKREREGRNFLEKDEIWTGLTKEVKLTDFGSASTVLSKEDERSARLAERAQKGDYDDGIYNLDVKTCGVKRLM